MPFPWTRRPGYVLTGARTGRESALPTPPACSNSHHARFAPNPYVFITMGTQRVCGRSRYCRGHAGNPFGTVKTYATKNTGAAMRRWRSISLTRSSLRGETVAVSGDNPGGVRMFTIGANSTLTEVTGSPFASGGLGRRPSSHQSSYVYAANRAVFGSNTGNIKAFAITVTGGTPTAPDRRHERHHSAGVGHGRPGRRKQGDLYPGRE